MAFLREHSKDKKVDPAALELIRRLYALEDTTREAGGGEDVGEPATPAVSKPTQPSAPPSSPPQPGNPLGIDAKT